jgi:lipoate-protein ligase B
MQGSPEQISFTIEVRRTREDHPWSYSLLDDRQRAIASQLANDPLSSGGLLLSEVEPVITLGRRTPPEDLNLPRNHLEQLGVSVLRVDRGGLATYHGPGQWVLFPVDRLERLTGDRRGVRKAVYGLLEVARRVVCRLAPLELVEVREGAELGVWTQSGKKLAAVGVHVSQGVLLHGLAINFRRTATSFVGLRPCGLDAPVGFIEELDSCVSRDFDAAGALIIEEARKVFWSGAGH